MNDITVRLKMPHVIDFYRWVIEERAYDRIRMSNWGEKQYRAALAVWESKEDNNNTFAVLKIKFDDSSDAVAFRLRYVDSDFVSTA